MNGQENVWPEANYHRDTSVHSIQDRDVVNSFRFNLASQKVKKNVLLEHCFICKP